jgi:hypothetical protein
MISILSIDNSSERLVVFVIAFRKLAVITFLLIDPIFADSCDDEYRLIAKEKAISSLYHGRFVIRQRYPVRP